MTLTRRPSPFGELVTLRQAMDRLFDDTVFRPYSAGNGYADVGRLALDVRKAEQVKPRQIRIQPVPMGEAEPIGAGGQPAKAGS